MSSSIRVRVSVCLDYQQADLQINNRIKGKDEEAHWKLHHVMGFEVGNVVMLVGGWGRQKSIPGDQGCVLHIANTPHYKAAYPWLQAITSA